MLWKTQITMAPNGAFFLSKNLGAGGNFNKLSCSQDTRITPEHRLNFQ
jgi:hypothetical protein